MEGAIRKEHTGEEASTSGEEEGGALAEDERPALTPILQGSAAYVPGSSGCLVARDGLADGSRARRRSAARAAGAKLSGPEHAELKDWQIRGRVPSPAREVRRIPFRCG